MNEAGLKGALGTLESFVGGVKQLVDQGVARCQDKVRQREALCLQDRESVLRLLVRAEGWGFECTVLVVVSTTY